MRVHGRARAGAAALLLLVSAVLAGCDDGPGRPQSSKGSSQGASPTSSQEPASSRPLDWKRCGAPEGGTAPGPAWRCATLDVPLDHARPDGETIGIALIRKAATRKSERLGSMLFNFGGPGGSGVDILPRAASSYRELNTRYDLVGFDPRGVAASAGVRCRDDEEQETAAREIDMTPDTPAEEAAFLADGRDFGAGCARLSGPLLPHVGTANAARDMDAIRRALGDGKLSYFGISYGTELGGTYAHLFPRNVGRVVLDAVVDPTADSVGHARNQAEGFQRALENYLKDRGQDPAAGTRRIARLLERIDGDPLPTSSGRELNESLAVLGIVAPLYARSSWPALTAALDEAENSGRGDRLLALADSYNGRDDKGHYDTQSHSQRAISCADAKARPTAAEARALLPEFRKLSPVFGPFLAWDTAGWCAGWPVEGEHDTPEASAPGAAPILVIGTTGDPATPYEGARRMADELGEGVGVMVTNKGEGHGAYGGNDCVTSLVDTYFLEGKVPADGHTCS
ncbi:Predicted hydrolases or acyltransferases (alpha/beta hydrolase superfamily) [Streptomyces sp. LamerLS-316]|uniref:alpha/beta hydrolase n=1 Tax=unclassified Streptomyces TaxID=2593676 RepID=UPI000823A10C|nr:MULTISPECIES: alpha/beta hydrolase [unclassified Streptomyces]MYQ38646.1 alpha/beta fold hydrolase [Streptomyces sp. SID4921]SCK38170.1 Predicted hydrolases or acyltransferases (alpha/beta hydrolase superfamily) [Streptomyces sp. LamerLS-316]